MNVPKLRFKEFSGEWERKRIIDLADYVDYRGKTPKKTDSGVLLITAKNIKLGFLDYEVSKEFIAEEDFNEVMRRGKVAINDILITTEAPLGNVASVDRLDIALAQRVIKYRGKEGLLNNLFLKQKFLSENFQETLQSKATGGTVQGIKGSTLHQIEISIPKEISEQTKIALFLTTIDERIAQLTQKHALLNQYKKGMMQQIFSQALRFKDENGEDFAEWEEKKLENYIIDYKKNTKVNDEFPVMTSSRKGLVFQKDYFGENRLTERDNTGFNIIPVDYITYRSRSDDGLFYFNLNKLGVTGIISTYYPVFSIKQGDNHFFVEMLNWHKHKFIGYAVGTSQLVLSINELKNMIFKIPSLPEQIKIANFLSSIGQKIDQVAAQLDATKQYKRGLLQQMFV